MNEIELVTEMLKRHEGLRLKPYKCTSGKLTIGYGRNIEDNGISEAEARVMLVHDIHAVRDIVYHRYKWYARLSLLRKSAVLNMVFNLGISGFHNFKKTIRHLEKGEFLQASIEMLDSRWAVQVGYRAIELSEMIKKG
jgi:lysozyme